MTIHNIQSNASGTRSIEITDEHLQTIDRYHLFKGLVDSTGYVDEDVLDKLKLNLRSLLDANSNDKELMSLCFDVIWHKNMKAFGLQQLIVLYINWKESQEQ